MMAGRIDLTVGFGIVMWHILAISLQVKFGVPWPLAILIVIACAALVGLINGLLVEVAQIDSFIATLGTGTILYALALWHTDGRQIIGPLPPGFIAINTTSIARHPDPGDLRDSSWRSLLWIVSERLPIGRHIYAIGANEKAAALNGIPVRAYVIGVFVASGMIAGLAGCVLAAKLRIGQANVGLDYLLPALVGAFLGSTTIKPGRVNVWGTIFGVLILAVGISGIQQLGGAFFVEPLFNGTTLVISIALAAFAQRRRAVARPTRARAGSELRRKSGRAWSQRNRPVRRVSTAILAVAKAPGQPAWRAVDGLPASHREGMTGCLRFRLIGGGLLASAAIIGIAHRRGPGGRRCLHEDGQGIHRPGGRAGHDLDRPTTGPKAQGKKLVIYVSADQNNGGARASAMAPRRPPRRSAGTSASSTGRARSRRARPR